MPRAKASHCLRRISQGEPRAPLPRRHFQRRRRGIFVVYHPHRFKLRRSGVFRFEFPDDVAPDGA
jgi:hypothetical protein